MSVHHEGERPGEQAGALASARAPGARVGGAGGARGLALRIVRDGTSVLVAGGGAVHAVIGAPVVSRPFVARLCGLHPVRSNDTVLVAGTPARLDNRAASIAAGIAVVTDGLAISWPQTVGENVLLGNERRAGLLDGLAKLFGRRPEPGTHLSDTERASRALGIVGLARAQAEPVGGLSGVERRLVELARALASGAPVIVVDDTGSGLPDADRERWWRALAAAAGSSRESGVPPAVVLVTGTAVGLAAVAKQVTVLGGPVAAPTMRTLELRSVGDERRVVDALAASMSDARSTEPGPDVVAGGRVSPDAAPVPPGSAGLTVEHWTASHPADVGRTIVDGMGFHCAPGEVLGLFGPPDSGAGEVLLSLFGRSYGARIDGAVLVDGEPVDVSTIERARTAGVLYTTEHPIRFDLSFLGGVPSSVSPESLTRMVSSGVADARRDYRATTVPTGLVAAIPGAHRGPSAAQFTESLQLLVGSDARVVLLAEPFGVQGGSDAEDRRALIGALAASGRSVVVSSEDPVALAAVCDRVLAVRAGRIVGEAATDDHGPGSRLTTLAVLTAMGGIA